MWGDFVRYAVYWVPKRPDPLARFGYAWTGWCAEQGEHGPRDDFAGNGLNIRAITRELCGHGIHGVVRSAFRLRSGRSRFSLERALDEIMEDCVAFQLPRLELAVSHRRVALVPTQGSTALDSFLDRIGTALAPLAGSGASTPLKVVNGVNGHAVAGPSGHGAHRFHVPLTDALPEERALEVAGMLKPLVEPILAHPRMIKDIALMGDPGGGRPLRVLQRYDLLDWPRRRGAARALPCFGPRVLAPLPAEHPLETDLAF